jgi:hypothetical protein
MAPLMRSTTRPSTPIKPLKARKYDIIKKGLFFNVYNSCKPGVFFKVLIAKNAPS